MNNAMAQHITQQQLESYLWGAATLLRGTIDAGDYKQFIFPLLFYKRLCDVFDEETQTALAESDGDQQFSLFPENHRFQIPPEAHWRRVRQTAGMLVAPCRMPCAPSRLLTLTSSTASLVMPSGPTRTASPTPCYATWSSILARWS